jgi:uncharacterized protein
MEILPPQKIKVVDIEGKIRGVIATQDIKSGEIIEVCPIVFISKKEADFFEKENSALKYYYLQQTATNKYCIMFGYGSLYNHSFSPNADIDYNEEIPENFLFFKAIKDIKAGEEIVFDYEFDNNVVEFLDQN